MFHDCLLKMLIQTQADIMAVYKSQLIHQFLLKNLALLHGSNFRHGIKYLKMTTSIPPAVERLFAKQMNATTISLPSSHVSYVSHPDEIAKLILDATK